MFVQVRPDVAQVPSVSVRGTWKTLRFGHRTSAHFLSYNPFFARPRHKISSMFPAGMLAVTGCKSLKRPLLYYTIS